MVAYQLAPFTVLRDQLSDRSAGPPPEFVALLDTGLGIAPIAAVDTQPQVCSQTLLDSAASRKGLALKSCSARPIEQLTGIKIAIPFRPVCGTAPCAATVLADAVIAEIMRLFTGIQGIPNHVGRSGNSPVRCPGTLRYRADSYPTPGRFAGSDLASSPLGETPRGRRPVARRFSASRQPTPPRFAIFFSLGNSAGGSPCCSRLTLLTSLSAHWRRTGRGHSRCICRMGRSWAGSSFQARYSSPRRPGGSGWRP